MIESTDGKCPVCRQTLPMHHAGCRLLELDQFMDVPTPDPDEATRDEKIHRAKLRAKGYRPTIGDRLMRVWCRIRKLIPILVWRGIIIKADKDGRPVNRVVTRGMLLDKQYDEPALTINEKYLKVRFEA